MTEIEHEELKKRLIKANRVLKQIYSTKKEIVFYTGAEMSAQEANHMNKEAWAHKKLLYFLEKLTRVKKQYTEL